MPREFSSATAFRQSLEERLRQVAEARAVDTNSLRLKLLIERLLARLFAQPRGPWLLKGGYAMELRYRPRARTTKDLDLAFVSSAPRKALDHDGAQLRDVRDELQAAAERDLGDFLIYRIGAVAKTIQGAPEGGARFPVIVTLAGKEYGRFHVDVGVGSAPHGQPERLEGDDLLSFAGVSPVVAYAVSRAAQFAEKIHAYTRPWGDRENTRTKDLIDLLLLIGGELPSARVLRRAVSETFAASAGHTPPTSLAPPPASWQASFATMAEAAGLATRDLGQAFATLARFWEEHGLGSGSGDS